MKFIIISGLSGAGKSTALHALEDEGFYCMDNLPLEILDYLVDRTITDLLNINRNTAVCVNSASTPPPQAEQLKALLKKIRRSYSEVHVVFLEASKDSLIQRYNETKRPHPLSGDNTNLNEAIALEHRQLEGIACCADTVVSTTALNRNQLRRFIRTQFSDNDGQTLHLLLQSFGYKKAVPADSDYVFDTRCLPNPYWQPTLREKTGRDEAVIQFFEKHSRCQAMFDQLYRFIENWMPHFIEEGRKTLTVSVGCTGGQHRSVYMVEKLYKALRSNPHCTVRKHHCALH